MKSITWQLVRGYYGSSKIIGWFGAGFYSHIDVVTPAGYLRGARSDVITISGTRLPAGVEDRPPLYELWEIATQYTIDVTDDQWRRYWDWSDKQLHKPYDTRGLLKAFLLGQPRDWREDDSWWCSELVARNGEIAGLWSIPPEKTSVEPGDCAFLFAGKGARRQEIIPAT